MQCVQSDRGEFTAEIGAGHVCAGSKRGNLLAMGPDGRSIGMDLLVTIIQIVKDLLGSLNPLRLFGRDYRAAFRNLWRQESHVFRIGFFLGLLGLLILLGLVALTVWSAAAT